MYLSFLYYQNNKQFNEGINDIFQLKNWPTPWSGWTSTKCWLNRVTSLHDIFTGLSRTGENIYKWAQVASTLKQARRRNPRGTSQQALLGRCWAHLSPVTFGGSSIPSWLLERGRNLSRLHADTPLPRKFSYITFPATLNEVLKWGWGGGLRSRDSNCPSSYWFLLNSLKKEFRHRSWGQWYTQWHFGWHNYTEKNVNLQSSLNPKFALQYYRSYSKII